MRRMPVLAGLVTLAIQALSPTVQAASDLQVNSSGHYLEKISDGSPFLMLSDTQWMLNCYTDEQIEKVLDDRAAKGFTAIQVFATHSFAVNSVVARQTDSGNRYPFVGNDPQVLNAGYWEHWRWICDEAAERGLHFILVMGEPGRFGDSNVPWRLPTTSPSATQLAAYHYGRQVASYFDDAPNVIFCLGQDSQADGRDMPSYPANSGCLNADGWRAMAEGTADGANGVNNKNGSADYSTNLMTYHGCEWADGYFSDISASFQSDSWIDFYGPEVFHDNSMVNTIVKRDYLLTSPTKPSFVMEGSYEREAMTSSTVAHSYYLRIEAWHSLFSGICGYSYGHCLNWQQHAGIQQLASIEHLNSAGARQMSVLGTLVRQYAWQNWVPDGGLITANAGSGATLKVGVRSSAGTEALIYFPANAQGSIKNLLTTTKTATWVNPQNGATVSDGAFTADETRAMTPPTGWQDAVLVLGTAPVMPQELLVNGSFEEGFTGWTNTAGCEAKADEGSTAGTKSLVLGSGNATGAVVTQTVTTVPGATYTLRFEYGAYGAPNKTQQVLAQALNAGSPITGITEIAVAPANSWSADHTTFAPRKFTFVAGSTSTTIRFTDQTSSTNGNSCDGIVDDVLLTVDSVAPVVAAPEFHYPPGGYGAPVFATLTSSTPGAVIRFTANGSDPTIYSTLYTAPLWVTNSVNLKARAFLNGAPSSVSGGSYIVHMPSSSGAITDGSFEASSSPSSWSIDGSAWEVSNQEGIPSGGESYAMALGSGNRAGDAVLNQNVATVPGANYKLTFQYGAFGASGKTQKLVAEALNGGDLLASTTLNITGPNSYNALHTNFAPRELLFTATSTTTTIRFSDQTTSTNSFNCDGVLDLIAVTGLLPSPWIATDIGTVGLAGGQAYTGGLFLIDGAGSDIAGTADSCRYVYQLASGNCEFIVRVGNVGGGSLNAMAGAMIRDSLLSNSACVAITVGDETGSLFISRASSGNTATSTSGAGSGYSTCWVKLVRDGNNFSAYTSPDASTWTQVGTTVSVTMGSSVYIGMCRTSRNPAALGTSTFDTLDLDP